jgi:hypothetical protein
MTSRSDCPEGSDVRVVDARKVQLDGPGTRKRLRWELASDDVSVRPFTLAEVGWDPSEWNENTGHIHTEFVEDGYLVHIDVVSFLRHGPLRGFWEVRIFIDGELAGRGGAIGYPPCSGNDLPAVARVGRGKVIAVAKGGQPWPGGSGTAFQRPVVMLHKIVKGGQ